MKPLQSPDVLCRRLSLRHVLAVLILLSFVGCGVRQPPIQAAAVVAGEPIRQVDVQRYMDYTARFFAWAGGSNADRSWLRCATRATDPRCRRLQRQVLARLIEERVVVAYATQHHIVLSQADGARITEEMRLLTTRDAGTSRLFRRGRDDRTLMSSILRREHLIQKVEDAVAPAAAKSGPSFHLEEFLLPIGRGEPSSRVYRAAVDLATDGKPIPATAHVRFDWVAPFRLGPEERSALQQAGSGDYVGPFRHKHGYLVILLLGKGEHAYGKPARLTLETHYFRGWLGRQVRHAAPRCFDRSGARTACPLTDLKLT